MWDGTRDYTTFKGDSHRYHLTQGLPFKEKHSSVMDIWDMPCCEIRDDE